MDAFRALAEDTSDGVLVAVEDAVAWINPSLARALGGAGLASGRAVAELLAFEDGPVDAPGAQAVTLTHGGHRHRYQALRLAITWEGRAAVAHLLRPLEGAEPDWPRLQIRAASGIAASLAHELNNPLAAVIGNLDFAVLQAGRLEETPAVAEVRELITEALKGAEELRALVAELRTLGGGTDQGWTELGGAVQLAQRLAKSALRERARLDSELSPLPPVTGSTAAITTLVLCALLDATALLPAEGAPAVVRLRTAPLEPGWALLEVSASEQELRPEAFAATRALARQVGASADVVRSEERLVARQGGPPGCVTVRLRLPLARLG